MSEQDTDAIFSQLVENLDLQHDGLRERQDLEPVRMAILESLSDHLIATNAHRYKDTELRGIAQQNLSELINQDLESLTGLSLGDEIQASGDTIFLLLDTRESEDDSEGNPVIAVGLNKDVRLTGELVYTEVMDIPDIKYLDLIRAGEFRPDGESENDVNPYGVGFILKNAWVIHPDGHAEPVEERYTPFLPLNYPQLVVKRLVSIDAAE